MRMILWGAMVFAVGCNANIGGADGNDSSGFNLDARAADDGAVDTDADPMASDAQITTPDAPRCSERIVWLQFEGITLTRAATSDATLSHVSWIGRPTAMVPKFLAADPDRAAKIDLVTERVRSALAMFPIQVVTTKPASGNYVLIAFGGTSATVDTQYNYAVNALDCGDTVPNDVGWVADDVPFDKADDYAVGAIGYGLGLTGTYDPSDCMCGWATACSQPETTQCVLHPNAAAEPMCPAQTNPQNEPAAFEAAFCTP